MKYYRIIIFYVFIGLIFIININRAFLFNINEGYAPNEIVFSYFILLPLIVVALMSGIYLIYGFYKKKASRNKIIILLPGMVLLILYLILFMYIFFL